MNRNHVIIIGIILLIIIGILVIRDLYFNEKSCKAQPLTYGVDLYSKLTNSELRCNCKFDDITYLPFTINTSGLFYLDDQLKNTKVSENVTFVDFQKFWDNIS